MNNILLIDDQASIRKSLREILEYEKYQIEEAENGLDGLEMIQKTNFDVVICDIKMPKMDGIEFLEKALVLCPEISIIMISGHGTIETAVNALKIGAYDYLEKPIDLNRGLVSIRNAIDRKNLVVQTNTLLQKVKHLKGSNKMIGKSEGLMKIQEMISKVAPTDARVLITGANGSGKELVAQQIHENSNKAKEAFIEVNCAAIPSELIESELFGHEKGAFTSAMQQRIGKFEQATKGTLFLDEIGDMSLSAQAKVLRALQENKITRVGGNKDIEVTPRILAATNKDLREEISKGNFREDLYHRLSVIIIEVPSLNQRKTDIPDLIQHFSTQICASYGIATKKFDTEAIKTLQNMDWTGNIRELRNIVERLIILGKETISKEDVGQFAQK